MQNTEQQERWPLKQTRAEVKRQSLTAVHTHAHTAEADDTHHNDRTHLHTHLSLSLLPFITASILNSFHPNTLKIIQTVFKSYLHMMQFLFFLFFSVVCSSLCMYKIQSGLAADMHLHFQTCTLREKDTTDKSQNNRIWTQCAKSCLRVQVHVCSQTLLIRSAELQSLPQKDLLVSKREGWSRPGLTPFKHAPMSTSRCGKISINAAQMSTQRKAAWFQ